MNKVTQGDIINSLTIERYGNEANKWDALKAFKDFNSSGEERKKVTEEAAKKAFASHIEGMQKTASGLYYKINNIMPNVSSAYPLGSTVS